MKYKEFREKFECDFLADLQDNDEDGQLIIRPNVKVAVPEEEECLKQCFNIIQKQKFDLNELYNIAEDCIIEFSAGIKLKLTSIRDDKK
jgi:hypothetical protein